MRDDDPLLTKLRDEIGPDLVAVQPLRPAAWRAAWLLLIFPVSVYAVLTIFGFRANYGALGPLLFWALPGGQVLAAYLLFAAALKQVVPGSRLPLPLLSACGVLGLGLHLAISLTAFQVAPFWPPAGQELTAGLTCFTAILVLTLLPAVSAILLARRGLPLDPLLTGVLLGLSGGLVGEATWRMHCPVTSFQHVSLAHTGAILLAMLAGLLIGLIWQRRGSFPSRHFRA